MTATSFPSPAKSTALLDLAAIGICTLVWGTTWFAITLQLGVVDPVVSVTYRFATAGALVWIWCLTRGESLKLSRTAHIAAAGMGFFTFVIDYVFVYWAEQRVISAAVAVTFASMAFFNLILFRIVFAQRAGLASWLGAALGVAGVFIMCWSELAEADLSQTAIIGLSLALTAVISAAIGNLWAHHGERHGAAIGPFTAWAMTYAAIALAAFVVLTGRAWTFEWTPQYAFSLVYLALCGSFIAFLLYFGLARRRGYATASYIGAMTPPVAMLASSLFEAKTWGIAAFAGIALVVAGQVLLLRSKRS